jgi:hypothetical protein
MGLAMNAPDKVSARGGVEDFTRNAWLSRAFVDYCFRYGSEAFVDRYRT